MKGKGAVRCIILSSKLSLKIELAVAKLKTFLNISRVVSSPFLNGSS
jgi:hypothetical protein